MKKCLEKNVTVSIEFFNGQKKNSNEVLGCNLWKYTTFLP